MRLDGVPASPCPSTGGTRSIPINSWSPRGRTNDGLAADLQAEDATVVKAQRLTSSAASAGGYEERIDGSRDERSDSFVDLHVDVPTSKTCTMTIKYANGGTAPSTREPHLRRRRVQHHLLLRHRGLGTPSRSVQAAVNLTAGANIIGSAKGSPNFAGGTGTGYAELGSVDLQ